MSHLFTHFTHFTRFTCLTHFTRFTRRWLMTHPQGGRADFQKLAEKETMNNTNFEQKKKLKQNKLIKNDQRFHLPL